ncbi:MAG TPA: HD domain-containing phosphohydrolase, partial [Symbiobacteriaceae bacterium]|nr:HD domain-containing phosphohydrolase [Symbiobacteriaceae bacterium]
MLLAAEAQQRREAGAALLGRGLLVAAGEEFARWLALVEPSGGPDQIIPALNGLAKAAHSRGDQDGAVAYLHKALSLCERPEADRGHRLRVFLNLMMMYTDMGRLDDALQALHWAEELGVGQDPAFRMVYWLNQGMLYWRRQEWQSMREASDKAYRESLGTTDIVRRNKALTNRGIAFLELGEYDRAEADLKAALSLADRLDHSELAYAYAEFGRLHFLRGDYVAALDAGRDALGALLTDLAFLDKEEVARVSRLFGIIFSTLGQRNLALKYLNRSAAYYSQLGLRGEWQRSTEMIGQVLSGPVRPARSQLTSEVQQLDFLTGVLDLTDDLESVDPYLRGHSERVANLARLVGEESDLSEGDLVTLSYAARLHDVGMVAVDAELLRRDGPLSEAERRRVAMHTTIGEEMLRPYGLPQAGLQAIRHHHEHYDGSGSPDGLTGEQIPLLARIITVVDVYDALTSERVYR